jgi:hypothetical protein
MHLDWKELLDDLVNQLDEFDIYSYRLNDGSQILAEVYDDDEFEDVILIDLPVSLKIGRNGQLFLSKWIFQRTQGFDTDHDKYEPVELQRHSIIATARASNDLKREYLKYNFLVNFHEKLDREDFKTMIDQINQINNIDLDTPDTDQKPSLSPEEMYNKRIKYPYWN